MQEYGDEVNLGVTLDFYIQNVATIWQRQTGTFKIHWRGNACRTFHRGKILCPVVERKNDVPAIQKMTRHNQLIAQAREGDEDATESLTLEDMDTYALPSQSDEKIFSSIVKSTLAWDRE